MKGIGNPLTGSSQPAAPSVASLTTSATGTAPWNENPFPPSKLPRTGEYLIGRRKETATLTRAWTNSKTHIVQIVAAGVTSYHAVCRVYLRVSIKQTSEIGKHGKCFDKVFN